MKRVSWKRIGIALAIILASLWLVQIPVRHYFAWKTARLWREEPGMNAQPTTLADEGRLKVQGSTQLVCGGWTLSVPNTKVKEKVGKDAWNRYVFEDGSRILCMPPIAFDQASMYREMDPRNILFRPDEIKSNFALTEASLTANPKDVSFWQSNLKMTRLGLLLQNKSLAARYALEIHPVNGTAVRGFEIVAKSAYGGHLTYRLILYSFKDQEIELDVGLASGGQPWINTLIDSIQPPSTNAPESDAAHRAPADA